MSRFPFLRTYRAILLIMGLITVVLGFFIAMAASYLPVSQIDFYSGQVFIRKQPMVQIPVFIGVYLIGTFLSVAFLFMAEIIKLIVNIEDHLFTIRNPNKPISDIRRAKRIEDARQKVVQEVRKHTGSLIEQGRTVSKTALASGINLAQQGLDKAQNLTQNEIKTVPYKNSSITPRQQPPTPKNLSTKEIMGVGDGKTGSLHPAERAFRSGTKLFRAYLKIKEQVA